MTTPPIEKARINKARINKDTIGIAHIGAGRIGRLRATITRSAPQVGFLALADTDPARVELIADEVGADFHSTDVEAVLTHPQVDAVIVSTPEHAHADPVIRALELGKPVLVEKPIDLTLAEADRILAAVKQYNGSLHVGYTQRLRRRFLNGKEQILQGRLGRPLTGRFTIYNPRHHGTEIYKRSPHAGPVMDTLTYMVDIGLWYFQGRTPARVYGQGSNQYFRHHSSGDGAWAILTLDDGSNLSLGASWLQPANWPANVCSMAIDLMGTDGALVIDDSHRDGILATENSIPAPYVAGVEHDVIFLESMMAGDMLLDQFWGPMRDETRSWLEHITTGRDTPIATAEHARTVLEVTLAIEQSAREGRPIDFPLTPVT